MICKDAKEAYLFGSAADSPKGISDMENDNFVTSNWEILTKNETRNIIKYDTDGQKLGNESKGESIGFLMEGGGFFIYWNGKEFKGVGGA